MNNRLWINISCVQECEVTSIGNAECDLCWMFFLFTTQSEPERAAKRTTIKMVHNWAASDACLVLAIYSTVTFNLLPLNTIYQNSLWWQKNTQLHWIKFWLQHFFLQSLQKELRPFETAALIPLSSMVTLALWLIQTLHFFSYWEASGGEIGAWLTELTQSTRTNEPDESFVVMVVVIANDQGMISTE